MDAYHQGNQIVIEVSDDGRGIDRDELIAKAVERGLLKPGDAAVLGEADIKDLIFHPGLSTAEEVTSISGRGVGMDVVKTVLEKLKGSVSIRTIARQRHYVLSEGAAHAGHHQCAAVPRRRPSICSAAGVRGGDHAHVRNRALHRVDEP